MLNVVGSWETEKDVRTRGGEEGGNEEGKGGGVKEGF
jgi:hypothetical protein